MIPSVLRRLAVLGAGCAIGLAIRSMPSRPSDPPRAPEPTHVALEEIRTPRGEEERKGGRPAAPSLPAPEVSKALSDVLRSIPSKRPPEGKAVISGRVFTDRGGPLAGVRIELNPERGKWPVPKDLGWKGEGWSSRDESAFTFIALTKWEEEQKRTTLTDESGAFRFAGISEDIGYHVHASLEGWEIRPMKGWSAWLNGGEEVRFMASPVLSKLSFAFACILPDGREPERAELVFEEAGQVVWTSGSDFEWTPSRREFSLAPGVYVVRGEAEIEGVPYRSDPTPLTIGFGPREPIELLLLPRAGPGIYGEVLFPPGAPPEAIPIYAKRIAVPEDARLEHSDFRSAVVDPKRTTQYSIDRLSPGLHYVAALWERGGPIAAEALVELSGWGVRLDLHLQPPDPAPGFAITAYSPEGDPLPPERGFWAWLEGVDIRGEGRSTGPIHLRRLRVADGSFRFFPERSLDSKGEGIEWILSVETSKYGSLHIPFDPRKEREARVQFQSPALPRFWIQGYAESAYRRGEVCVRLRDVALDKGLDGEGRAFFGPVRPGTYPLEIEFEHWAPGLQLRRTVHRSTVDLLPGTNDISLSLPPLHDLEVSCPKVLAGRKITLCQPRRLWGWSIEIPSDGIAVFEGLPAGEYLVRVEGPDGGQMGVAAPSQGAIEFRPSPFDAFEVEHIADGSCLQDCGIGWGERIVGIGSELFEEVEDFREILEAHRDREEIYLLVQSYDGSRRAVPANPARLLADMAKGTRILPTRTR